MEVSQPAGSSPKPYQEFLEWLAVHVEQMSVQHSPSQEVQQTLPSWLAFGLSCALLWLRIRGVHHILHRRWVEILSDLHKSVCLFTAGLFTCKKWHWGNTRKKNPDVFTKSDAITWSPRSDVFLMFCKVILNLNSLVAVNLTFSWLKWNVIDRADEVWQQLQLCNVFIRV